MKLSLIFPYLLSALLTCTNSVLLTKASAQPRDHHHAPWDSPVAWSQTIQAGGARIQLDVAPGPLDLSRAQVVAWVQTAARAVSEYYGRFPVHRARVLVIPVASRRGVHGGYLLTRTPSEISVGEVLQVVDNRFVESSCDQMDSDRGFVCSGPDGCGLQRVWRDVRSAVAKILFETSFADVCAHSSGKRPPVNPSETLARLMI